MYDPMRDQPFVVPFLGLNVLGCDRSEIGGVDEMGALPSYSGSEGAEEMNVERRFHVVGIKDGDLYVAQALEVDVAAQGKSPEEALERLRMTIRAEDHDASDEGRELSDLGRAPPEFHALYKSGADFRDEIVA